jgi:hypothetical protein
MTRSSIKNSNVEVTISQNPVEVLRNDRSVVQSSHEGLIKSTSVTGCGEGLLHQGLSLNKAQALFYVGILSSHQFNVGNLYNYHLKAGDLSELHVHKLSNSHAFLATSSSDFDDDLSLLDSQALLPFKLSGVLSFKCDNWYHQTNCLAYQSVTTCHWYHQTNCLTYQWVMTCHRYSSVTTCHCLSNSAILSLCLCTVWQYIINSIR